MDVDFGRASKDYSRHRAGFPPETYALLADLGIDPAGLRALDVGCGTGTLARGLAARGARAAGLDPSPRMLAGASQLAREEELDVAWITGRAERLPLADEGLDLVTCGQCWHWFDAPVAAAEIRRVLRPGGRLCILSFDWVPLPGNVVAATEELILAHNPDWHLAGGDGLHPEYLADAAAAGFTDIEERTVAVDAPYSHEAWRGRIRASAGVGASLAPEAVRAFDEAHARLLRERFSEDPLAVPHRVFVATARRR